MSYRIDIGPEARLELLALPAEPRRQARELIRSLAENPRHPRAKPLCSDPVVRRVWLATLWRVAYQLDEQAECVRVLRIFRRDLVDYESLLQSEAQDSTELYLGARGEGARGDEGP